MSVSDPRAGRIRKCARAGVAQSQQSREGAARPPARPQPGFREQSPAGQRGLHPGPRSPVPTRSEEGSGSVGLGEEEEEGGTTDRTAPRRKPDRKGPERLSPPLRQDAALLRSPGGSRGPGRPCAAPPLPLRRPRGPAGVRLTQHANHLQRHRLRRRHRPVTSPPRPPPPLPPWA